MKIENLKLKIVFLGSDKFVLPIVEELNENFDLSLIVTTEHNPNGPVSSFTKDHKIELVDVQQFNNVTMKQLSSVQAPIAVLAYFGVILPPEVLNIFPKGIINIHPSLLPKYRGPTPVQTAILNGETETGVTIIKLDEEVDHGPVFTQEELSVEPTDTTQTLHEKLFTKGAQMLPGVLNSYLNDSVEPIAQNHTEASFTDHLTRDSGYFDGSTPPGKTELDRMIRAYFPWPGVWTTLRIKNKELRIKLLPATSHPELDSGSHSFLLQVEGKNPMSYKDFLNGYPELKDWLQKIS